MGEPKMKGIYINLILPNRKLYQVSFKALLQRSKLFKGPFLHYALLTSICGHFLLDESMSHVPESQL